MTDLIKKISEVLYPPRCPACDKLLSYSERQPGFCAYCRDEICYVSEPICKYCGKPIRDEISDSCADCAKRKHHFEQGRAVYVYDGPTKEAMYRFKYSNRRRYADIFAADACRMYEPWIRHNRIDLIVPIPMNRKKERRRGYNQAAVLAKELGRRLDLPVEIRAVERSEDTTPQKELSVSERRENLKNAFNIGKSVVKSKRILLIDDIYTTGSTMDAVSGTLLASGADKVYGLCACIGRGH